MSVIFLLLLSLLVEVLQASDPCPASHGTVKYVEGCPKTSTEWHERSKQKKCADINQPCTERQKFRYHCLINEFLNATVEVCAPVINILGSKCAEYNTIGRRIQDNAELPCKKCPFSYDSDFAHEYQECYAGIPSSRSFQEMDTDTCPVGWLIVAIISIVFNVILLGAGVVVYLLRKSTKKEIMGLQELPPELTTSESPDVRENDTQRESDHLLPETAPTKEERNTCFAAIQIGERYCGFAFSKGDDPARVQLSTAGSRTTTRLLLHKGKGKGSKVDVEMFGYDARETHITKGNSSSYIYFDELIFIEKDDKMYIKDSKGNEHDAEQIYQEFIKCLVKHVKDEVSKDVAISNTEFIFTVPDHWDEKKISLIMKIIKENVEGGARAEILNACLAVSPFLHEVKEEVLCHNFNVKNLSFFTGTEYAVLNIGSYCCNISILEVKQEGYQTDKIVQKSFEKWNSNSPEEWFLKFLSDIVGNDVMKTTREKFPKIYFSMLRDFEVWKENVASNRRGHGIDISILPDFVETVENDKRSTLGSLIKISAYADSMKLTTEGGSHKLSVDKKVIIQCFSELAKRTSMLVEKHILNRPDVKCVCMTGVYSKVQEVQDSMKKCFDRRTVVIPSIPELVVGKGAAYHRYTLYANNVMG